MRISKTAGTIRLGRADVKLWQDAGPSGVEFRRDVRAKALAIANETSRAVEVLAASACGGWVADQILPGQWER